MWRHATSKTKAIMRYCGQTVYDNELLSPNLCPVVVCIHKTHNSLLSGGYASSFTPSIATEKTGNPTQLKDTNTRVNQISLTGNRCNLI